MIYILAQGTGSRWDTHIPEYPVPCEYKQMIPVLGEPNILRTVRMLREMGRNDFQIIAEGIMFSEEQVADLPNQIRTLRVPGTIIEGIYQILQDVNENVIFLLGDVIFSKAMLSNIIEDVQFGIFGRYGKNKFTSKKSGEIFAVRFPKDSLWDVKDTLRNSIRLKATKLWEWWEELTYLPSLYIITPDWTDDIDSPIEYHQFYDDMMEQAEKET